MVAPSCKLVYSGRLREEDRLSPGVRDQPWRTVRSHMQINNKHCHVQRRNKVFLVGLTGRFNIDFWGNYFIWYIFGFSSYKPHSLWEVENTNSLGGQIGRFEKYGWIDLKILREQNTTRHLQRIINLSSCPQRIMMGMPGQQKWKDFFSWLRWGIDTVLWAQSTEYHGTDSWMLLNIVTWHCYVSHHSAPHSSQCSSWLASLDPLDKRRGS